MNLMSMVINWSKFCQMFGLSMVLLIAVAIYGAILYMLMAVAEEYPFLGLILLAFWFIVPFVAIALLYSIFG